MKNSFPTFPNGLGNDPTDTCGCTQLFVDGLSEIYLDGTTMVGPFATVPTQIQDNRNNTALCAYQNSWEAEAPDPILFPMGFFENFFLVYDDPASWGMEEGLGKQWVLNWDNHFPVNSPLLGGHFDPCNPVGVYTGGVDQITVSFTPFV